MGWSRLDNPKPSKSTLGKDSVRVAARGGARNSRYVRFAIGPSVARRASFTKDQHKCHLMVGSGSEAGQLAITVDDASRLFLAKRRADGRYEISVTAAAAEGRFSLTFPPFERETQLVPMGTGPSIITFQSGVDFLLP